MVVTLQPIANQAVVAVLADFLVQQMQLGMLHLSQPTNQSASLSVQADQVIIQSFIPRPLAAARLYAVQMPEVMLQAKQPVLLAVPQAQLEHSRVRAVLLRLVLVLLVAVVLGALQQAVLALQEQKEEARITLRLQAAAVKQRLIDTFAYHALSADATASAVTPQPPRRYALVDPRTVHLNVTLRVRDGEERVRQLCDSLPADNPIKFVAKMRATIGARGVLVAKSRRGSLKLRFDNLDLAEDKREFWYPAEALTW